MIPESWDVPDQDQKPDAFAKFMDKAMWNFKKKITGSALLSEMKEKTVSVLKGYGHDLEDFARTIKSDTQSVIQAQLKDPTVPIGPSGRDSTTPAPDRSGLSQRLQSLQADVHTFDQPEGCFADDYQEFAAGFALDGRMAEITSLLEGSAPLRRLQTQLVPREVTFEQFWKRYFFRADRLVREEQRRVALLRHGIPDTEDLGWGDEAAPSDPSSWGQAEPAYTPLRPAPQPAAPPAAQPPTSLSLPAPEEEEQPGPGPMAPEQPPVPTPVPTPLPTQAPQAPTQPEGELRLRERGGPEGAPPSTEGTGSKNGLERLTETLAAQPEEDAWD
ncbi:hypothetical protein PAPYR_7749 [Paratrimastix pyriformis]|uniref:BSD domain-containing protein n=1 Tax=Paratrimastix pyriformis TaxID=342808 RepID=A0ABQ8UCC2_9EUKA|nr:hypothetical protein PAPYR_7749 [Paratrimastix pyriformis]